MVVIVRLSVVGTDLPPSREETLNETTLSLSSTASDVVTGVVSIS